MKERVTKEIQGRDGSGGLRRRRELVNRVECEALRRLTNVGWTDEARAASLAVRRANAAARGGPLTRMPVSGIRANGRYRTENGKTVFIPDRPSSMPPAGEGEFVVTAEGVSSVLGGKLVRLGSPKVVSVGPHGTLCVTFRGRTYNLGDLRKMVRNGNFNNPNGGLYRIGKVMYARIGGGWVSLETGEYLIEQGTRVQIKRLTRQNVGF